MFKRADLRLGVSEIKAVAEDAAKEVHRTRQKLEVLVKETAQAKAEAVSNQMAAGLYDSPNGGYERAIRDAGELLATQGDPRTYTFWVNLAAAHGQRAEAAQKKNDGTEFQDARRDALEAVQKAMLYDVGGVAQGWIRLMLAGSVPEENDLVAFKNDPDFKKLVS
jgi:hypothetical protein